jgi:hypothetical protein
MFSVTLGLLVRSRTTRYSHMAHPFVSYSEKAEKSPAFVLFHQAIALLSD